MGWYFQARRPRATVAELIREEHPESAERMLDIAVVGRSEAYIAYRADDGSVVALVFLVRLESDQWGYKPMDEGMGPYAYRCPTRILDRLDPTDNDNALEWRAKCRERLAQREAAKAVKPGTKIKLAKPLEFTDGRERDQFTFEGGSKFRADDGVRVRVTNWRERSFTVVGG